MRDIDKIAILVKPNLNEKKYLMNCRKRTFELMSILTLMAPFGSFAQQNRAYEMPMKIKHQSPSGLHEEEKRGYEILGHMEGLKEGEKVTMGLYVEGNVLKGDSAYVKNGEFHMQGVVLEGPRFYNLKFEQHPWKVVRLFIDNNDKITIQSSNIEKIPHDYLDNYIKVDGSRSDFTFRHFIPVMELYSQTAKRTDCDHYLKQVQDSVGFDPSAVAGVLAARDQMNQALYYMNFYKVDTGYISAKAVPYLVKISGLNSDGRHPAILREIYENLDESVKNTYHGKELKEAVKLCIGEPFPDFNLPNPDGNYVSSKEIVGKSKATIVQFWAITSIRRAMYQDELKAIYKKYHDKGLNVIGVSSDTTGYMWRGFVKAQQYPWETVSDLKGGEGVVGKLYKEYGYFGAENTTNVLIDGNGKIVAWDASGIELQYYLWKMFGE